MDLSESRVKQGRRLVESLDRSGLVTVEAALWFYFSDSDYWRLVLSIKDSTSIGTAETYRRIQRVIADQPRDDGEFPEIKLRDVTIAESDSPIVAALSSLRPHLETGGARHGLRLRN